MVLHDIMIELIRKDKKFFVYKRGEKNGKLRAQKSANDETKNYVIVRLNNSCSHFNRHFVWHFNHCFRFVSLSLSRARLPCVFCILIFRHE